MNKIVREHYPAERLPDDLRDNIPAGADVRITIEVLPTKMSPEELLALLASYSLQSLQDGGRSTDAVAEVRSLRDEWDD